MIIAFGTTLSPLLVFVSDPLELLDIVRVPLVIDVVVVDVVVVESVAAVNVVNADDDVVVDVVVVVDTPPSPVTSLFTDCIVPLVLLNADSPLLSHSFVSFVIDNCDFPVDDDVIVVVVDATVAVGVAVVVVVPVINGLQLLDTVVIIDVDAFVDNAGLIDATTAITKPKKLIN